MSFALPWWLLGWVAVAAAAAWTLLRPARQQAHVGSLTLWQEALAVLDRSARRRSRRVTASWLCLLAGAALAVGALAGPRWHTAVPRRHIGLVVVPTVELGADWLDREDDSRASLADLLERLSSNDRVTCVLPPVWPAMTGPASPAEVLSHLRALPAVPAAVADVSLPTAPADTQHVVYAVAPSTDAPAGPATTVLTLGDRLRAARLDALAAQSLPDGRMQVFAAVWRYGREDPPAVVRLRRIGSDGNAAGPDIILTPSPGRRGTVVWEGPASASVEAVLESAGGGERTYPGTLACLVRRRGRDVKVALVGPDEPMVRRYLAADKQATLVAEASEADVVVAVRTDAPADRPALVLAPPSPPPGWRAGPVRASVDLTAADLDASHTLLRGVDLAGVAVRRLATWQAGDLAGGAVASMDGHAILLAPAPDAGSPKRVYLSFELAPENTNLMVRPDGVVLLANVLRYLAGMGKATKTTFVSRTPLAFGPVPAGAFTPMAGTLRRAAGRGATGLLAPGLYTDADGMPHAICLPPLGRGEANGSSVSEAIDRVRAVPPRTEGTSVALWPWAAALAGLCWLAGWSLRLW